MGAVVLIPKLYIVFSPAISSRQKFDKGLRKLRYTKATGREMLGRS